MEGLGSVIEQLRAMRGFLRSEDAECQQHGRYRTDIYSHDGSERPTACPRCFAAAGVAETARLIAARRADGAQEAIDRNLKRAAIPERFRTRTLDNFEVETDKQQKMVAFCRHYADTFHDSLKHGRSLIFCGSTGTGKNHLSIGIAQAIISRGHTAIYSTVSSAVRRVRSTWGKRGESEEDAIGMLTSPDLLILDEVGIQTGTDNEHVIVFDILNGRYEAERPTILLTNLPVKDEVENGVVKVRGLTSYVGDRIIDRMREGGGKAFHFDWPGYRGRNKEVKA